MATMDIIQWKTMVKRMLLTGWNSSDEFVEWVAQCALSAYEDGDVDDDVASLLEANEQEMLNDIPGATP